MSNSKFITDWVLDKVKNDYRDDIALVVSHTTLRIDDDEKCVSYFVPVTDKGRSFAQDFIFKGQGFDIWGIEWERLEGFAALEEYNITCLADGDVLYARTDGDKERFEALKALQARNLSDPAKMRANALEAYVQAKSIYLETLFSNGGDVKLGAGYVLDYLAQSIAFTNHRYFKKAQTAQLEELSAMAAVPHGFTELYKSIIMERDESIQKKLCYEVICMVRDFLETGGTPEAREHNFQDLAAWYCELSYTWLRVRYYCQKGDAVKAYMWAIALQEELNRVSADFGFNKFDLLIAFDPQNLAAFSAHSDNIENSIRSIIADGGGIIREYDSEEEFLNEV